MVSKLVRTTSGNPKMGYSRPGARRDSRCGRGIEVAHTSMCLMELPRAPKNDGTSCFHVMEAAHKIGVVPSWHCTCSINRQRSFGPGPDVHECGAVCMRGENARAAALPC